MLLPVAGLDGRILDRISAMDHHSVAHINAYMGCTCRIIGSLEEDQISRFCLIRRYIGTAGPQALGRQPSHIPTISAVIDNPGNKSRAVKAGGW